MNGTKPQKVNNGLKIRVTDSNNYEYFLVRVDIDFDV